tara:strand:+ start:10604 stop:11512 length:909 start_codon:yes stop_codon:yes gene_type:complete
MSKPLFSIIIPHYNDNVRLIRLLDSIPDKSELQVIVVDDNSLCDISDLLQYVSKRSNVLFIQNHTNVGAGCCRNIAIDLSHGSWLLFSDSDDYFTEDAFNFLLKQQAAYINYKIVYFNPKSVIEIDSDHMPRDKYYSELITAHLERPSYDILFNFDVPWSKIICAEFVKLNKFKFSETTVANDILFATRLAINLNIDDVKVVLDSIYYVTERIGSLTSTLTAKKAEIRVAVINERNTLLKSQENAVISAYMMDFVTITYYYSRYLGIVKVIDQLIFMIKRKHPLLPKNITKKIISKILREIQ